MTELYEELEAGSTVKWTGSSINYTFLQWLPDYYLNGASYASWYDNIVDTANGFSHYTSKQRDVIYYILEDADSIKISKGSD